ncbi:MAG: VWA domain-containing protein [Planctomycetes bacterium]|nr:VWA domain-containing protein [Planctomycetota bacterium]
MTWLVPLAGIILAAATLPPLLALYILRLRRPKRTVASTLLWTRQVEDLRANSLFQRMRMSWLLILQALAIVLLALALAQPQADLGLVESGRVVLLIDRSASMGVKDADGRSRLDQAKREAHERVDALFGAGLFSQAPEVMVVAFAGEATVLSPFSTIAARAHDAIDAIEATDESTTLFDALDVARSFMAVPNPDKQGAPQESGVTLDLWSDGRIPDLDRCVVKPGENLRYRPMGSATARNAGIGGAGVSRLAGNPDEVAVFARIMNWDELPLHSDVELWVDGTLRAVLPSGVDVPAAGEDPSRKAWLPGEVRVSFPSVTVKPDGIVEVRLVQADDQPADNRMAMIAAPAAAARVLLVGASSITRGVVQALPVKSVDSITLDEFSTRSAANPAWIDAFDVIVLDGASPTVLPPSRYLVLGGIAPFEGLNPYGDKADVSMRSVQATHPLMRFVNLDELGVSRGVAYSPASDVETIVEGSDGPLVMTLARGGGQAVVVAFDPLDSNWPFQRGFVNFMANAVEFLAASGREAALPTIAPGETQPIRLGAGVRSIELVSPASRTREITVTDPAQTVVGPLRQAGIWSVRWQEGGEERTRSIAVALQDPREGRVGTVDSLSLGLETVRGVQGGVTSRSALWPWLILAALAVLTLEWLVYLRKV